MSNNAHNKNRRNDQARRDGHYPRWMDIFGEMHGGGAIGPGMKRAAIRLAAKAKANSSIPSGAVFTRQQRRAAERAEDKKHRITAAECARINLEFAQ